MSGSEIIIVLIAAWLLFGGQRLPELMRSLGRKYREMRLVWEDLRRQIGLNSFNEMPTFIERKSDQPPENETPTLE